MFLNAVSYRPGTAHTALVDGNKPVSQVLELGTAAPGRGNCKRCLMSGVIVDDPLMPEFAHGIDIQECAIESPCSWLCTAWSGIECVPAIVRKIRFHPRMSVACTNDITASDVVVHTAAKSIHDAGWNSQYAKHQRH